VILNDAPRPAAARITGDATLDDLFRLAAARRPDDIALVDPPNRASFTDGKPQRLTYAQADRVISAIAARLHDMNIRADAVVGLQIANTVDSVLALLAVSRAGLIAMPLPLLWRRADAVRALRRAGASALIVSGRIGGTNHFDLAVNAAAEVFGVRQVCGFGQQLPDGVISLDDLCAADAFGPLPAIESERAALPGRSAHVAAVTWDVSADGAVPFGRSHAELIAGGLAVLLESRVPQDAVILSTFPAASFGAIATTLLPWLLVGGTLVLHHAFDEAVFAAQCRDTGCDIVVVPGPLVSPLAQAGYLSAGDGLKSVVAVWRAPEQLGCAADWREAMPALIDVQVFGEVGLIAGRRGPGGTPAPMPLGSILAPRGAEGALTVLEVAATPGGTVALRGPMVPGGPFPPRSERGPLPHFAVAADGFVDTGYPCQIGSDSATVAVSGSPAGVVSFGGYRFAVRGLAGLVSGLDAGGTLSALPDTLAGHRLAGSAADPEAIRTMLQGIGANPLLVAAFGGDGRRRTDDGGRIRD
jgi:hypothetical protein